MMSAQEHAYTTSGMVYYYPQQMTPSYSWPSSQSARPDHSSANHQCVEACPYCKRRLKNKGRNWRVASGYVFLCDSSTLSDVLSKRLFGAPLKELQRMRATIDEMTKLFLWNTTSRTLYGSFQTEGEAAFNLDASAFGGNFPSQLGFSLCKNDQEVRSVPLPLRRINQGPCDDFRVKGFLQALHSNTSTPIIGFPPNICQEETSQNTQDSNDGTESAISTHSTTAGFVFLCSQKTRQEVLQKRLFGLPSSRLDTMTKSIDPSSKLFLWDTTERKLYGPFQVEGTCCLDLDPTAFDGKFPAQQRFSFTDISRYIEISRNRRLQFGPCDAIQVDTLLYGLRNDGRPISQIQSMHHPEGQMKAVPA